MSYRINWYSIDKNVVVDWDKAYKHTIEGYGFKPIFSDCATDLTNYDEKSPSFREGVNHHPYYFLQLYYFFFKNKII